MIPEKRIRAELEMTVGETDLRALGRRVTGKVRDSYLQPGRRILVVTDRLSAFDCVLGTVPFKGQVLNQLAAFWFERTRGVAPNHVLDVPDPNIMVVAECEQLPIEIIVRGYITGVTKTSLLYNYQQGIRNYCGNVLPEGLRKDQKLPEPIITPTTKLEKHDRPVSREEAVKEGLVTAETFDEAADICLRLFDYGRKFAAGRGLILAGSAAGLAAAFNAPIAGLIFCFEEVGRCFDKKSSVTIVRTVAIACAVGVVCLGDYEFYTGVNAADTIENAGNKNHTNGTPLTILIPNLDRHFIHIKQYQDTNRTPRPGHASYASFVKYGPDDDAIGAGFFSGRYTSTIVAAGCVAKKVLRKCGIEVFAYVKEAAGVRAPEVALDEERGHDREQVEHRPGPRQDEQDRVRAQDRGVADRDD